MSRKSSRLHGAALSELKRVALNRPNDAAILAARGQELSNEEISQLDLSSVAAIQPMKGEAGFDVKLINRLDALKLLLAQSKPDEAGAGASFLEALARPDGENDDSDAP